MTPNTITTIPPDAKGYSGMTKLWLSDTVAITVMAVGEEAERVLRAAKEKRDDGNYI